MPIYEYLCPNGHRTERLVPLSGHCTVIPCPECRATAEQTLSGAVLKFRNEKYGHFMSSFDSPYAKVDANPWTDDTDE